MPPAHGDSTALLTDQYALTMLPGALTDSSAFRRCTFEVFARGLRGHRFAATSNLAAGQRYGIPTAGTAAHAFILLHDSEADAFATQVAALGTDTTLLVDTYDITRGIATAIEVAGPQRIQGFSGWGQGRPAPAQAQ